jgi:serine/threonine protein kinase
LRDSLELKKNKMKILKTILRNPDKNSSLEELIEWYLSHPWTHPFASNALQVDTKARLGNGSFGVVYRAKFLGEEVAAKTTFCFVQPDLYGIDNPVSLHSVIQEVVGELVCLSRLNHPNVVRLRAVLWDELEIQDKAFKIPKWIVLNLIQGTNMEKLLQSNTKKLPVGCIAKQLSDVLCYFRSIGHVHRDLKPGNLMFDETTNKLTVTDFGIAKASLVKTQRATQIGTPLYTAPEIALTGIYGPSVDMYSTGVVLIEVFLNETPGFDKRTAQIERIKNQHPSFGSLLQRCISDDPKERPDPLDFKTTLDKCF